MSREDRRPLAPVPEDSVDTYMHPFPSYPIPESSTLYPPYNIFHTFYYPSANASLDTNLAPVDWDHYQPTYAPDLLCAVGAEYPDFPAIMQSQELLHHKSVPHPAHSLLFMPASPGNQGQVYYAHHPTPMPAGAQDLLCASGTEYLDFTARMRSREPFHAPVPHPAQSLSFLPDPVPEYQAPVHDPDLSAPACEWDTIVNMVDDFFANTEYCDFYAAGAMPAPEVVMPSPRVSALYEDSGAYLANDFIATTEYCQHATPAPELVPTSASYEGTGAYMANDFFADTECDFFEVVAPSSPRSTGASPRKRRILKPRPRNPPPPRTSGFIPSDPDDISPHEKKRLYLQCLENYVMYLHSLFARINVAPLPLERVSNYRITSRSMRTILLHLGKSADTIQNLTVKEQNRFKDLRDAYLPAMMLGRFPDQDYQNFDTGAGSPSASDSAGTSSSSSSTCVEPEPESDAAESSKLFFPGPIFAGPGPSF